MPNGFNVGDAARSAEAKLKSRIRIHPLIWLGGGIAIGFLLHWWLF